MKKIIFLMAAVLLGSSACKMTGSVLGRTVAELDNPFATLQLFFNT
ncbi:MAG: hypothetical protein P1V35_03615 [Planctomycetota bacterium]|nr:hypothetical protein [Planctomycetota bacterium]